MELPFEPVVQILGIYPKNLQIPTHLFLNQIFLNMLIIFFCWFVLVLEYEEVMNEFMVVTIQPS